MTVPNLAARPFVNERPIRRVAIALWSLALVLLLINGVLLQRYFSGRVEQKEALVELQQQRSELERGVTALEQELATFGLREQNAQIVFLNDQITRRTFSWSELFDRLAEVLPPTVQLSRVVPSFEQSGRGTTRSPQEPVELRMSGVAQSSADILSFVDALFAHPSFTAPDLSDESMFEGGSHGFSLGVRYLPGASSSSEHETMSEDSGAASGDASSIREVAE